MEKPLYTIAPRGNLWRVLVWEYTENGSKAEVVAVCFAKESAIKKLKELYGQVLEMSKK